MVDEERARVVRLFFRRKLSEEWLSEQLPWRSNLSNQHEPFWMVHERHEQAWAVSDLPFVTLGMRLRSGWVLSERRALLRAMSSLTETPVQPQVEPPFTESLGEKFWELLSSLSSHPATVPGSSPTETFEMLAGPESPRTSGEPDDLDSPPDDILAAFAELGRAAQAARTAVKEATAVLGRIGGERGLE